MMTLWLLLFIIGTVVLAAVMFFGALGDQLPGACPRCGTPDEELGGVVATYRPWYRIDRGHKLRCRHCDTTFKEHPNGTIVEDREA